MLELRQNCELCGRDLLPHSPDARICSYECTFCAACVESVLHDVCPNCEGGFQPRPIRAAGVMAGGDRSRSRPSAAGRRRTRYTAGEIDAFVARLRDVPPAER